MTEENLNSRKELLKKYILHQLFFDESERLEDEFLENESLAKERDEVEFGLIEDYVLRKLSKADAVLFKENYLTNAENIRRVEEVKQFYKNLEILAEEKKRADNPQIIVETESPQPLFFTRWRLISAVVFSAILLLIIPGVLLISQNEKIAEIPDIPINQNALPDLSDELAVNQPKRNTYRNDKQDVRFSNKDNENKNGFQNLEQALNRNTDNSLKNKRDVQIAKNKDKQDPLGGTKLGGENCQIFVEKTVEKKWLPTVVIPGKNGTIIKMEIDYLEAPANSVKPIFGKIVNGVVEFEIPVKELRAGKACISLSSENGEKGNLGNYGRTFIIK